MVKKSAVKGETQSTLLKGSFEQYQKEVLGALQEKFKLKSPMQVPRLQKIVLSMGLGETKNNKNVLTEGLKALSLIAGQKAVPCIAKNSIAGFKLREGMAIGAMVTLRKKKMYEFLQRLIHAALPRVRDFHGLKPFKGFDAQGNYSLGLKEASAFPEIAGERLLLLRGLSLVFVIHSYDSEKSLALLKELGMPFAEGKLKKYKK